ncbi:type III-B CRISPR-associated protein Cas10/Cmr2 [Nocardiopsis dassonvillei]|uniref:Cas10/Cmr2 second palm domain-containing protein n=1 Tax=Nocardiopsis dassonvillei TaxID=2014 RepID=UPI00200E433E|nr:type III-B CRISPR-associated protein Cas10/Cmr2 [Nocardiopsis dassonvillei]MCK9874105.1 type III-B CRISPR-associated protein Cas10/Cmr2 [Nocardiopsis dassonvillei]
MSESQPRDLVLIALAGVQRFITESRTTLDLRSASRIVARLASEAAGVISDLPGTELVFPTAVPTGAGEEETEQAPLGRRVLGEGMPSRVVALVPAGDGTRIAERVYGHVRDTVWPQWSELVYGQQGHSLPVPGWPVVQWVVADHTVGSYTEQWHRAHRELAARKNIRGFVQDWVEQTEPCSLSPRWPSSPPPAGLRPHEQDTLCSVNWVRRRWPVKVEPGAGIASTSALASAPFRDGLLRLWDSDPRLAEAVGVLHQSVSRLDTHKVRDHPVPGVRRLRKDAVADWFAVNGGRWVYPSTWNSDALAREFDLDAGEVSVVEAVEAGARAAGTLTRVAREHQVSPLSRHLAVLVQDLDSMGRFLSGEGRARNGARLGVEAGEHARVSSVLGAVAERQHLLVHGSRGRVVYAGGDDLLALLPSHAALGVAAACRETVPGTLPTVSSAVVYFHHRSSLRQALTYARELLDKAKDRKRKHGLGVGFLRRSGSHAHCALPWTAQLEGEPGQETSAVDRLSVFAPAEDDPVRLSPGLVQDLAAGAAELNDGRGLPMRVARAEIRRLTERHTMGEGSTAQQRAVFAERAADALLWLGREASRSRVDLDCARVAVFLRQEVS